MPTVTKVDQAELFASPLGVAFMDWLQYLKRIIDFDQVVSRSVRNLIPTAPVIAFLGKLFNKVTDEQRIEIEHGIALGKHEIDTDFEFMHALLLIAAWGSFEAFVDDACVGLLQTQPELLDTKPFANVKIPPSVLLLVPGEQMTQILEQAKSRLSTALKNGVGKFESQLELVGLDGQGDISDELRDAIFYTQQIRNVWAHKGGRADKRFIEKCPALGYGLGDTVAISTESTATHLRALMVYGMLIMNRYLAASGIPPMPWPDHDPDGPFSDPYAKQWGPMQQAPVTGWWAADPATGEPLNPDA